MQIFHKRAVSINNPSKYNYQLSHDKSIPKTELKNICILHYNTCHKPWKYEEMNEASIYYWKAYSERGKKQKRKAKQVYKSKITEAIDSIKMSIKGFASL